MLRKIELLLPAKETSLPGNFTVYRALPRRELRRVGGFVFLDHFDAENVKPENFDVPPHPHIGLQTVTYLFEGEILHTDSLGYQQFIEPGAVNWMTAGKGVTHSEQVMKILLRMHGVQSWVGLPHDKRKIDPAFKHYGAAKIPLVETESCKIRVIAGSLEENASPIMTFQPLTYLDVEAFENCEMRLNINPHHELAIYVCEGEIEADGQTVKRFDLAKLSNGGGEFEFSSASGARFILFGGENLPEPTVIYWNFIADSVEEAKQAALDWENGKFPEVAKYKKFKPADKKNSTDEQKKINLL